MNRDVYDVEAEVASSHWWFVGRRRLLSRLIAALRPDRTWRVLEIGAGTGANLAVLAGIESRLVVACDVSVDALRRLQNRATLARADATSLPFMSDSIDLLLAADVIEHVERDDLALREFVRVLRPGGHLILTVPAFQSLWGPQDIVAQHRRRYRRRPLLRLVRETPLSVTTCFHFNYVLFLPIWAARKILLALRVRVSSENQINTSLLNWVMTRAFGLDVDTAPTLKPPFGVSLCLVATKPPA
ncbi:MAG TPA: class I SAM-dependent methyltransferase [Vicinamibacterales bacterium]|nr:class I SAM-dependent methyltransferase [Vicinamibacterales bacterium]